MRLQISLFMLALGTVAHAEAPKVVTDIAPVHGLVAQVMEGVGSPDLVIPPGASPHSYAMRPSEARALEQADIVFWVGPVLAPWLEEPIETLGAQAEHVTFSDVDGITLLEFRENAQFEPHDHDHGHDDAHDDHAQEDAGHDDHGHEEDAHDDHGHEDAHGHDDHDEHAHDDANDNEHADKDHAHGNEDGHEDHAGGVDGHLWLNPENAQVMLGEIAQRLAAQDPENAEKYMDNAKAAQQEIAQLSAVLASKLEPVADRSVFVAHDSYHYFEAYFGVQAVASIYLGDESAASASQVAKVRETVEETGARCALAEQRANKGLIAAVGDDINVATLDALGVDIPLGPDYYTSLLNQIADGLVTCLSGTS